MPNPPPLLRKMRSLTTRSKWLFYPGFSGRFVVDPAESEDEPPLLPVFVDIYIYTVYNYIYITVEPATGNNSNFQEIALAREFET